MASAQATTSPGGNNNPVCSCWISASVPPMLLAITGTANANDSMMDCPNSSYHSEGKIVNRAWNCRPEGFPYQIAGKVDVF